MFGGQRGRAEAAGAEAGQPAGEAGGQGAPGLLAAVGGAAFHVVLVAVAPRRDHQPVPHEGVGVADQHGRQHADVALGHLLEGGEFDALLGPVGRLDDGHRRVGPAVAQEEAAGLDDLPVRRPLFGL
jgi:hypothetical protein